MTTGKHGLHGLILAILPYLVRRRGLTQHARTALAQMATTALHRFEHGLQSLYAERLATLARALGVSAAYLLGLQDTAVPLGVTPPVPERGVGAGG